MAFKKEISKFFGLFKNILASKQIDKYEFVHIMYNEKFNAPFIDFANKYFDTNKHCFVFFDCYDESVFKIPDYKNVFKIINFKNFHLRHKNNIKKIILHGLFLESLIDWLYRNPYLLDKCYWVIWGSDLYDDSQITPKKNFYVKQNIKGYITPIEKDFEIAKQKYGFKGECYPAWYISPTKLESLNSSKINKKKRDYISIQIEHSANKSIPEILRKLERFKNKPIIIKTILSYNDINCRDEIIKIGQEVFNDKFIAITEYMSPEEYSKVLTDTDILIMNQKRQQGVTNIRALLYLGAKIYLRSDISTWDLLTTDGFKVFDTLNLDNETFESFIAYNQTEKENNLEKSLKFFDEDYIASLWEKVFNS